MPYSTSSSWSPTPAAGPLAPSAPSSRPTTSEPLVEISDDRGHGLDFVAVPHEALTAAGDRASQRFAS
jgi:hypothetical protein